MWGRRTTLCAVLILLLGVSSPVSSRAQAAESAAFTSATTIPQTALIQPQELVNLLKAEEKDKPLVLQVGSRVMFSQEHIPGAQYAGPASQPSGIESIETTVASLPKSKPIVIYCGCCPWGRCPNMGPAYKRLQQLGFTHVRALYLANNFGDDWVGKGYPSVKGK